MLLGTEIGAALTALEPFDVDVIGLNCATGPAEMNDAVRYLGLEFNQAHLGAAERGTAAERRRTRGLQTHAAGAGAVSQAFRLWTTACESSADAVALRRNISRRWSKPYRAWSRRSGK